MSSSRDEDTLRWDDPLANKEPLDFTNLWSYTASELEGELSRLKQIAWELKDEIDAQNAIIHPFFPDNHAAVHAADHAADKVAREMHCIGLSKSECKKFDAKRGLAKELREKAKKDLDANTLDQAKIISELEKRNKYYFINLLGI